MSASGPSGPLVFILLHPPTLNIIRFVKNKNGLREINSPNRICIYLNSSAYHVRKTKYKQYAFNVFSRASYFVLLFTR